MKIPLLLTSVALCAALFERSASADTVAAETEKKPDPASADAQKPSAAKVDDKDKSVKGSVQLDKKPSERVGSKPASDGFFDRFECLTAFLARQHARA